MAKGTGTYDDPILVDGLFTKTINGVKKFFKIKTGSVDTSNLVKKSGDTLNGNYFFSDDCNLYKTNKTSALRLNASNDGKDGARLVLCGKDNKGYPAEFNLCANDGTSDAQLIGKANGKLYWNNNEVERVELKNDKYIRFTSGLTFVWGTFGLAQGIKRKTINLPIAFKSEYKVFLSNKGNPDLNYGENVGYQVIINSLTSFDVLHSWDNVMGWYYFAVGY